MNKVDISLNEQQIFLVIEALSGLYETCVDNVSYFSSFEHFDIKELDRSSKTVDIVYGLIMYFWSFVSSKKGGDKECE